MFSHLKERNLSYLQHLCIALTTAFKLQFAVFALIIHSIVPCLFEQTASSIIINLNKKFKNE